VRDKKEINQDAIEYLSNYNVKKDRATKLFESNAKANPSYITLNNYGVNMLYDGNVIMKNKFIRFLAVKYLKKANRLKANTKSYIALGGLLFERKKYTKAIKAYKAALSLETDDDLKNILLFNIALSYFGLKKYHDSYQQLIKIDSKSFRNDELEQYLGLVCNILYFNNKEEELIETFKIMKRLFSVSPKLIEIAFLSDNYEFILKHSIEIIKARSTLMIEDFRQIVYSFMNYSSHNQFKELIDTYEELLVNVDDLKIFYKELRKIKYNKKPKIKFNINYYRMHIDMYYSYNLD